MRSIKISITPKVCTYWILYMCVLFSVASTLFGISDAVFYICDLVNIALLYYVLKHLGELKQEHSFPLYVFLSLLVFLMINALINKVPILLVLWGIRNLCRFFVIFFAVILFFTLDDVERIMHFFFLTQVINICVGLYKYFVLGLFSDSFGGGIFFGGSSLNPFCILLLCFYTNKYFWKEVPLNKYAFILSATFILGAMAEEKMMIMVSVICLIGSVFIHQYTEKGLTLRNVSIVIGLLLGLVLAAVVVNRLAPDMLNILLNKDAFMETATVSFDEGYRIPRVGSFVVINKLFLGTMMQRLIGLGIGNCDTSSFAFLQSDFYKMYGDYNYRWFTNQWTYLECGIIGFGLYLFFYIAVIIILLLNVKKYRNELRSYIITSAIYSLAMIFLMWHSSASRFDTAFIIYFGMAIGFVAMKHKNAD